jgi:hypothetical protein
MITTAARLIMEIWIALFSMHQGKVRKENRNENSGRYPHAAHLIYNDTTSVASLRHWMAWTGFSGRFHQNTQTRYESSKYQVVIPKKSGSDTT